MKLINGHLNTIYSFMNSAIQPQDFLDRIRENNCEYFSITERNNFFSLGYFLQNTQNSNLKPIFGLDLDLILEENKITIKKDDKLSYTKVFDLDNYTTAFLKLDNMVMNTKIKTIFLRNTNNHININAKEYSINDEFLSEININIYFKGEN